MVGIFVRLAAQSVQGQWYLTDLRYTVRTRRLGPVTATRRRRAISKRAHIPTESHCSIMLKAGSPAPLRRARSRAVACLEIERVARGRGAVYGRAGATAFENLTRSGSSGGGGRVALAAQARPGQQITQPWYESFCLEADGLGVRAI